MMSLTIIAKDTKQAEEVAMYLVKEKLVIEANLIENTNCFRLNKNQEVVKNSTTVLICTTKSLLFNQIDEYLKGAYGKDMPVMYSVPIINMDWEQSKNLIEGTQKI